MPVLIRLQVLCHNLVLADGIRAALLPESFELVESDTDQPPDITLTDRPDGLPLEAQAGLISFVPSGAADVVLDEHWTPRELQIACSLLAQVVALRRSQNAARTQSEYFRDLAFRDPLTDLPNRRAWDELLAQANSCPPAKTCLLVIDLDGFKAVNREHGYHLGDEQIKRVSQQLLRSVGDRGLVARLGGDEFVVRLADVDPEQIDLAVEQIRTSLERQLPDRRTLTATAGYVIGEAKQLKRLFYIADEALRQAKEAGRNRSHRGIG